jgi:hypothetical protein
LARTHDHAEAVLTHPDTPENTGKTPDQNPKRLNDKLRLFDPDPVFHQDP